MTETKTYNRQKQKTYAIHLETLGRAESDRMKKGLTARCAGANGYEVVTASASHKGGFSADVSYRVESGAATPTHIKKMIRGVAEKAEVDIFLLTVELVTA
jgi:hypothetical protein